MDKKFEQIRPLWKENWSVGLKSEMDRNMVKEYLLGTWIFIVFFKVNKAECETK